MTHLLNDIARCDGLLAVPVTMPDGRPGLIRSRDCPRRDTCARHQQTHRDDPGGHYFYADFGSPDSQPCGHFIPESDT